MDRASRRLDRSVVQPNSFFHQGTPVGGRRLRLAVDRAPRLPVHTDRIGRIAGHVEEALELRVVRDVAVALEHREIAPHLVDRRAHARLVGAVRHQPPQAGALLRRPRTRLGLL